MMAQKVGKGGMVKGENGWVHNVSERQLEWGWPFPGQIRLACQDCLEEKMEVVETYTQTQQTGHTACIHSEHADMWMCTN